MRINGRQYSPKRQYNRPSLSNHSSSSRNQIAHNYHSSLNQSPPRNHSPNSKPSPALNNDYSVPSYFRCSSADVQLVLDDVECEYADSVSTDDLHPFGQELPSESFKFELSEMTEPETAFIEGVIDEHEMHMNIAFVSDENTIPDIGSIFQRRGVLGSGASCRVLRAQHMAKRKDFALKEMSKAEVSNFKKFKQEVEVLTMLDHPNIITFEDCYADDNNLYIATEYCSGDGFV